MSCVEDHQSAGHRVDDLMMADLAGQVCLRAGSKPDYLCDVLLGFLVLAAFWCLGKLFVPAPSFLYILGFIAAVAAAAGLYVWSGKGFGGKETAALTEAVREAFHTEKA